MGIVRFALRFPHTFYVVAALVVFLGIAAIRSMPTDIFPEIRIPVVTVIWQYTGLSTPEMEQRVTTYSQYAISLNVSVIQGHRGADLGRPVGAEDLSLVLNRYARIPSPVARTEMETESRLEGRQ